MGESLDLQACFHAAVCLFSLKRRRGHPPTWLRPTGRRAVALAIG